MHRSLAIAILGAALIIAGMVTADAQPRGSEKIAYVDLERTLIETPAGKRASARFEKSLKAKQNELDKERKALEQFQAELEKQAAMLKPEVRAQRQREFQQRAAKLQESFMKFQSELANERAKLIQEVLKKAGPVIEKVAKEKGYQVVVDRAAVIWANDALDITAEINRRIK